MTYYEFLEISENASDEVVHMAYKALVKKYHPDVYKGDIKIAEAKIKDINEAFSVLSELDKRAAYDSFLKNKRSGTASGSRKKLPLKQMKGKLIAALAAFILIIFILPFNNSVDTEDIMSSVVTVQALDNKNAVIATGSGFCAFGESHIVTSYHLIEGAFRINFIYADGSEHTASGVLIFSKDTDLAILEAPVKLNPLEVGKADSLKPGDRVTAIGTAGGKMNTVSEGTVADTDDDYLISTFSAASQNSGGVLLNSKNEVIGITYASDVLESAQNINYAVKVSYLKQMYNRLKNKELEMVTTENYESLRAKLRNGIFSEPEYYGVDSVETFGCLTEERFEDTFIYTDIAGQEYDLSGIEQCIVLRTITVEDKHLADLIFTSMSATAIYDEENYNRDLHEEIVIRIMDVNGADQGGGAGKLVVPGVYVKEIDSWCFDSRRKEGDMAMIENDYGYTICYISFIYKAD